MRMTVRQPSGVYPPPMREKNEWQLLHCAATSSLPGPSGSSCAETGTAASNERPATADRIDLFTSGLLGVDRQREERAHDVPEVVTLEAEPERMCGVGQDDELAVAVRQPLIEVEQVLH